MAVLEFGQALGLRAGARRPGVHKLSDIHMRDPFLFADHRRRLYFLFGTGMGICDGAANVDPYFEVYVSGDRKKIRGAVCRLCAGEGILGREALLGAGGARIPRRILHVRQLQGRYR